MNLENLDIKSLFKENLLKGKLMSWKQIECILEDYEVYEKDLIYLRNWYNMICDLSFLKQYEFDEVIIHNEENLCYYVNNEKISEKASLSNHDLELSYLVLSLKNHIEWNFKRPFASFHAIINNNNFRVTLIHKSTNSLNFSKAFFRKISKDIFPLANYLDFDHHYLVKNLIEHKKNILICGPTGSGKTSLLNNFLSQVSTKEHVITIEDTQEIKCFLPNTTSLIAGINENKSMKDYLAYSLRMSPDRVILGEIRSNEVISFILALNTGHNGAMSTIHANNAVDAIHRIALLYCLYSDSNLSYELILKLVCQNIDYVFYMEKKKVIDICRIFGSDNEQIMYESIIKLDETVHYKVG